MSGVSKPAVFGRTALLVVFVIMTLVAGLTETGLYKTKIADSSQGIGLFFAKGEKGEKVNPVKAFEEGDCEALHRLFQGMQASFCVACILAVFSGLGVVSFLFLGEPGSCHTTVVDMLSILMVIVSAMLVTLIVATREMKTKCGDSDPIALSKGFDYSFAVYLCGVACLIGITSVCVSVKAKRKNEYSFNGQQEEQSGQHYQMQHV